MKRRSRPFYRPLAQANEKCAWPSKLSQGRAARQLAQLPRLCLGRTPRSNGMLASPAALLRIISSSTVGLGPAVHPRGATPRLGRALDPKGGKRMSDDWSKVGPWREQ